LDSQHAKASKGLANGQNTMEIVCLWDCGTVGDSCLPESSRIRVGFWVVPRSRCATVATIATVVSRHRSRSNIPAILVPPYPSEFFAHFAIERWAARMNFAAGASVSKKSQFLNKK